MTTPAKADLKTQATEFAKARWADFKAFTPGQKAVTIVAVLALAIGGYLLLTWKSTPSYAPLYSNLAATDASAIVGKLDDKGIAYKLGDGGQSISVPADQVDTARLAVSAAGLPNSGQTGYALLDKEGVTTSQFKQQVDYQRAVEGELGKTIQSIDGVEGASVHLAIPTDTVFSDDSAKPTAAVMLTVAPGTTLTQSQVRSVVYLVSSSVPGMKAGDVTVTDSNGTVLSAPTGSSSIGGGATDQADATAAYNTQLQQSIQSLIDADLGSGHAKVVVNSTLDFSKSTTNLRQYVYDAKNPPLSETKNEEKYTGAAAAGTGGTLGTVDTGGTGGSGGTYDKTSTTVDNALGVLTKTTETAPGTPQSRHIAVMLDKSAKGLDVAAITDLVSKGVGYDPAKGDSLSVKAVTYDDSAQTAAAAAAKKAAAAAAAATSHARLMSMIKQGAFAAVILALVVGTWLAARKRRTQAPPADSPAPREPEFVDDPRGPRVDLTERFEPIKTPVPPVNQRRSAVLDAVDRAPADVAQVLSGWLNTKEKP